MKSLESRNFVATPKDIGEITRSLIGAAGTLTGGRGTYLKALVGTSQDTLGARPRRRQAKGRQITGDEIAAHLAALEGVHERFYGAVLAAAREDGTRDSLELNKRTNFARTAKSKLRKWIKAGNDVRALAAVRVTHAALEVKSAPKSGPRLLKEILRSAEKLTQKATSYALQDSEGAVSTIEGAMAKLASTLAALGATPTKDAGQAVREHRPFRSNAGVFYPVPKAEPEPLRAAA